MVKGPDTTVITMAITDQRRVRNEESYILVVSTPVMLTLSAFGDENPRQVMGAMGQSLGMMMRGGGHMSMEDQRKMLEQRLDIM